MNFSTNKDPNATVIYYEDYLSRLYSFVDKHLENVMKGYATFQEKKWLIFGDSFVLYIKNLFVSFDWKRMIRDIFEFRIIIFIIKKKTEIIETNQQWGWFEGQPMFLSFWRSSLIVGIFFRTSVKAKTIEITLKVSKFENSVFLAMSKNKHSKSLELQLFTIV